MKKIGMGLIGPGFVATHHIDAVRRLGDVDVVAIAGSSQESADRKAKEYKVERAYGDFHALIADPDVQVIHNTTPNYLHLPVTMAALAGRQTCHLGQTSGDEPGGGTQTPRCCRCGKGRQRCHLQLSRKSAGAAGTRHDCTRRNGSRSFVHGHYLQDWMTDPNVYSWRSDPAKGGVSSALGDIGSHWCDLAEHMSGLKIHSVLADLTTVIPIRYSSGASAEAFSKESSGERTPVQVRIGGPRQRTTSI